MHGMPPTRNNTVKRLIAATFLPFSRLALAKVLPKSGNAEFVDFVQSVFTFLRSHPFLVKICRGAEVEVLSGQF